VWGVFYSKNRVNKNKITNLISSPHGTVLIEVVGEAARPSLEPFSRETV
jgi:hypothetical protein